MLGLRTQEGERFERFFAIVQEEAAKQSRVFFLDSGDGRELETEELSGEDLTGWLVPLGEAKAFQEEWQGGGEVDEKWSEYIVFATWKWADGKIAIFFDSY